MSNKSAKVDYKMSKSSAFTIVELLIVVVIIGILAAITIVSYSGITQKAVGATLRSDLTNASKKLNMYNVLYSAYPTAMTSSDGGKTYCPTTPVANSEYCIKPTNDATLIYSTTGDSDFTILATKGNTIYSITKDSAPMAWITIGSQTWAAENLDVGKMVTGATVQTNNSLLEKYCYNNDEANCAAQGGLYQWDEAMQYVSNGGAQGICPTGSHIPTDDEWKTLEMSLSGMSQATANIIGWRDTDEGTKLKSDGSSGMNIPLAGLRSNDNIFYYQTSNAYLWTSSEANTSAWFRYLGSSQPWVLRNTYDKTFGFSVRCLGD